MLNGYRITYKVERYSDSAFRIIKYYRNGNSNKVNTYTDFYEKNTKEEISLSRTKRNIRRICLSNDFEYFATWTIDSKYCDRFFLTDVVDKMKTLLKAYKRKNKDFKYIYIIEKHKNGAFHFHGLVKGLGEDLKKFEIGDKMSKEIASKVLKGMVIYHSVFFDSCLGFNTFTKIQHYNKCCNYIIKYISKDTVKTTENQIYFCSRGLSKGENYEVNYIPYELFKNCYNYEDLCSVKDLYLDELTQEDLLNFGNIQDIDNLIEEIKKYIVKKRY